MGCSGTRGVGGIGKGPAGLLKKVICPFSKEKDWEGGMNARDAVRRPDVTQAAPTAGGKVSKGTGEHVGQMEVKHCDRHGGDIKKNAYQASVTRKEAGLWGGPNLRKAGRRGSSKRASPLLKKRKAKERKDS